MSEFLRDYLVDTDATAIASHASSGGSTYNNCTVNWTGAGGAIRNTGTGPCSLATNGASNSLNYHSATPPGTTYGITWPLLFKTQTTAVIGVGLRVTTTGSYAYVFVYDATNNKFQYSKISAGSVTHPIADYTYNYSNGAPNHVVATTSGTTTVTNQLWVNGVKVMEHVDSSPGANLQTANQVGIWTNGVGVAATGVHLAGLSASDTLTAALSSAIASTAGVLLTCHPVGGTPAYTVAVHRSTTEGFTPSAATLIGSSVPMTDVNAVPNTLNYYKFVVTDAVSATATSREVAAVPAQPSMFVGAIGDSFFQGLNLSAGQDPISVAVAAIPNLLRYTATITSSNRAASGQGTADWLVGGSNMTNALAAFTTASSGAQRKYVLVNMNADCSSNYTSSGGGRSTLAQYIGNITSICATLIANGYTPVLFDPIVRVSGSSYADDTSLSLLAQYRAALPGVANGTTILYGGGPYNAHFASTWRWGLQSDLTHPNAASAAVAGNNLARAFVNLIYPVGLSRGKLAA